MVFQQVLRVVRVSDVDCADLLPGLVILDLGQQVIARGDRTLEREGGALLLLAVPGLDSDTRSSPLEVLALESIIDRRVEASGRICRVAKCDVAECGVGRVEVPATADPAPEVPDAVLALVGAT